METSFFNFAQETDRCHSNMSMISGRYMPSGMVILSFGGRWRGSSVHLIQLGTTDSCLHTGSDLTTEGLEPDHEFCMRVWMHLFHQQPNSPHWSSISYVLPFYVRFGSFAGRGRFGSRLLGCVRRFVHPPLLCLVVGPSPVRFFFSFPRSGFARSGLGVLVLVCSLFSFPLLRSPSRVPVK